jgi:hypothetical protein
LNAVERGWTCGQTIVDPFGRLDQLLRNIAHVLQSWSQSRVGQIRDQLLAAKVIIRQFDRAEEHRTLEDRERTFRNKLKVRVLGLASLERTMARLRSRITFLKDGDANSKLFHSQASFRTKKLILQLEDDHGVAIGHDDKEDMLYRHFSAILGTAVPRQQDVDLEAIGIRWSTWKHHFRSLRFG